MPKSKLRGGKKAHRKRVQRRNQKIKSQHTKMQKMWQEEMMKRMEELNATSGDTENEEINNEQPLDIKL